MNYIQQIQARISLLLSPLTADEQGDDDELLHSLTETDKIDISLAAAVALVDLAWADNDFEQSEYHFIVKRLRDQFQLSAVDIEDLLAYAQGRHAAHRSSYSFIEFVRNQWTDDQREQLFQLITGVIAADGEVDPIEKRLQTKFYELLIETKANTVS